MKTKDRFLGWSLVVLSIVAVTLPFISWILSALGLPVDNMLSDDGLRWFFLHMPEPFMNYYVVLFILSLSALASLQYVRFGEEERSSRVSLTVCFVLAFLIDALLLLAALHPRSPLISLTGRLFPSPLLHGLPFVLCFGIILVAFVWGLLTRQLTSLTTYRLFLSEGFRRYGSLMVAAMLVSFICYCVRYVI